MFLPISGNCSYDEYKTLREENIKYYNDKMILCPKSIDVDKLNKKILTTLPGEQR